MFRKLFGVVLLISVLVALMVTPANAQIGYILQGPGGGQYQHCFHTEFELITGDCHLTGPPCRACLQGFQVYLYYDYAWQLMGNVYYDVPSCTSDMNVLILVFYSSKWRQPTQLPLKIVLNDNRAWHCKPQLGCCPACPWCCCNSWVASTTTYYGWAVKCSQPQNLNFIYYSPPQDCA